MYGKTCLGVELDRYMPQTTFIANVLEDIADEDECAEMLVEFAHALRNSKSDSMGLGTILYFPDIPFEGSEDEDEEEYPDSLADDTHEDE